MSGLIFITDARFYRTPDGNIYAGEYSFSNILWKRYIDFFGEVIVIGRVFESEEFLNTNHKVNNVRVLEIKSFNSPLSFLKNYSLINKQISDYLDEFNDKAVIVRAANVVAYYGAKLCFEKGIPYGIEIINDPYDIFSKGSMKHPLLPVFKYIFTNFQKKATLNAESVIYVTEKYLQKRYPARKGVFTTFASDVIIDVDRSIKYKKVNRQKFKIVSIGALELLYKGPDVAIHVIKELHNKGYNVSLDWLGHGKYLNDMTKLSAELGVKDFVSFRGSVSSSEVVDYLLNSHCFILLSRTEGLPRAIVEAMSCGLPCVGSNAGGIPELIHPDYVVNINEVDKVVQNIIKLIDDNEEYNKQVNYSIVKAKEFHPVFLEQRRNAFFTEVSKNTKKTN